MRYCTDCAEINGWRRGGRRVQLPCEVCGRNVVCYDNEVSKSSLVSPAPLNFKKTRQPGPDGWLEDSILYAKGLCWIPCAGCGDGIGYMSLPSFPDREDRRVEGPFYCKECGEKL